LDCGAGAGALRLDHAEAEMRMGTFSAAHGADPLFRGWSHGQPSSAYRIVGQVANLRRIVNPPSRAVRALEEGRWPTDAQDAGSCQQRHRRPLC
jgi:hypothetical protein